MGELNVDLLRDGLNNYLEALRSHLSAVDSCVESAEAGFAELLLKQAGIAADEYRDNWYPAQEWLRDYVDQATKLAHLLDERITELDKIR